MPPTTQPPQHAVDELFTLFKDSLDYPLLGILIAMCFILIKYCGWSGASRKALRFLYRALEQLAREGDDRRGAHLAQDANLPVVRPRLSTQSAANLVHYPPDTTIEVAAPPTIQTDLYCSCNTPT